MASSAISGCNRELRAQQMTQRRQSSQRFFVGVTSIQFASLTMQILIGARLSVAHTSQGVMSLFRTGCQRNRKRTPMCFTRVGMDVRCDNAVGADASQAKFIQQCSQDKFIQQCSDDSSCTECRTHFHLSWPQQFAELWTTTNVNQTASSWRWSGVFSRIQLHLHRLR